MQIIDMKRRFVELAGELSPENLTCDGERPRDEAQRIEKVLRKEWAKLEVQFGSEVTEYTVYQYFLPDVRRADAEARIRQMGNDPKHPKLKHVSDGEWRRVSLNGHTTAYRVYSTKEGRFIVSFGFAALNVEHEGYASLDEAVECADCVLRGITAESIRQRFPRWEQFAIDREIDRARVS